MWRCGQCDDQIGLLAVDPRDGRNRVMRGDHLVVDRQDALVRVLGGGQILEAVRIELILVHLRVHDMYT